MKAILIDGFEKRVRFIEIDTAREILDVLKTDELEIAVSWVKDNTLQKMIVDQKGWLIENAENYSWTFGDLIYTGRGLIFTDMGKIWSDVNSELDEIRKVVRFKIIMEQINDSNEMPDLQ